MTMYDDSRVVTLLREIDPPLPPPDRLAEVSRRARRHDSRRASVLAGVMAVVLATGVVSAMHLGNRGNTETLTVAGAAQATAEARTARMTMRFSFSGDGSGTIPAGTYEISGPVDFEHSRYSLKGRMGDTAYETRGIGKDTWTKQPSLGFLSAKPWLHFKAGADSSSDGFQSLDPTQMLDALTKSAIEQSSKRVGDRTVLTLKVRGNVLDPSTDSASTHVVLVTVDDQDRVRKLETTEALGNDLPASSITLSFDDFGLKVDVQPPPADQVGELADVFSGSGPLSTPEGCAAFAEQQRKLLAKLPAEKRKELQKVMDQMLKACAKKP